MLSSRCHGPGLGGRTSVSAQEESLEVEDDVEPEEPGHYSRTDLTMIGSDDELQKDYWEDCNADNNRYNQKVESDDEDGIERQGKDIAADMEEEGGKYERENMENV